MVDERLTLKRPAVLDVDKGTKPDVTPLSVTLHSPACLGLSLSHPLDSELELVPRTELL